MPQYIPRREGKGKKKGATSPAGFPGIFRDTRGAYKSRVINGKCYIIHATHIQVYTYSFYSTSRDRGGYPCEYNTFDTLYS